MKSLLLGLLVCGIAAAITRMDPDEYCQKANPISYCRKWASPRTCHGVRPLIQCEEEDLPLVSVDNSNCDINVAIHGAVEVHQDHTMEITTHCGDRPIGELHYQLAFPDCIEVLNIENGDLDAVEHVDEADKVHYFNVEVNDLDLEQVSHTLLVTFKVVCYLPQFVNSDEQLLILDGTRSTICVNGKAPITPIPDGKADLIYTLSSNPFECPKVVDGFFHIKETSCPRTTNCKLGGDNSPSWIMGAPANDDFAGVYYPPKLIAGIDLSEGIKEIKVEAAHMNEDTIAKLASGDNTIATMGDWLSAPAGVKVSIGTPTADAPFVICDSGFPSEIKDTESLRTHPYVHRKDLGAAPSTLVHAIHLPYCTNQHCDGYEEDGDDTPPPTFVKEDTADLFNWDGVKDIRLVQGKGPFCQCSDVSYGALHGPHTVPSQRELFVFRVSFKTVADNQEVKAIDVFSYNVPGRPPRPAWPNYC
ncbi:hypothetical protein P9112_005869 [Eukaryota sp. TZLM1-RC]